MIWGLKAYSSSFVHEIINYCLNDNDLEYLEQNEFIYYDEEKDDKRINRRSRGIYKLY